MGTFFHAIVQFIEGDYKKAYATFTNGLKDIPKQFAAVGRDADKLAEKLTSSMNRGTEGIKGTAKVVKGLKDGVVKAKAAVEDLNTVLSRMEMQAKLAAHGEEDLQQKLIEKYEQVKKQYKLTGDEKLKVDLKIKESLQKLAELEDADVMKRQRAREQEEKKELAAADRAFKKKTAAHEKFLKLSTKDEQAYLKAVLSYYQQDLGNYTLTAEQKEEIAEKLEAAQEELKAGEVQPGDERPDPRLRDHDARQRVRHREGNRDRQRDRQHVRGRDEGARAGRHPRGGHGRDRHRDRARGDRHDRLDQPRHDRLDRGLDRFGRWRIR
jgi:hypothetical protein